LTRDEKTFAIIIDWYDRRFAEGSVEKDVNTMAPLLTMTYLYEETGDKKYLPYLDGWLEWVMQDMTWTDEGGIQHTTVVGPNRQQLWDDTLMMTVMPLARGGKLLNRPEYIAEAKKQFLLHIRYLSDKKTGLWFHGWNFEGRHNFGDTL
jgi:unsaturated rhamnogalacturonyl hydrolase